ncbi:short-subunit dehydrogenase [Marmoricola sp. OAE513]|uniref:SDR family NAD(P)-dependent oxidoreductase n=1 Tax=Marmoricola sp. OAE513 TaxID=2817894 RepID=UPI001AE33AEF
MSTTTGTAPLALVTGASSGIGRSLALQFLDHDFDVVVVAEDAAIDQLVADGGPRVHPIRADLATADGVQQVHRETQALGRPVAAAALNAGVGVGGAFTETDLDAHLNLVDLNVRSTVHLAKLLSQDMVERGEGRLLFTASIAATSPGPFHATYAASKAFVHSFAEGLRVELEPAGVTVTSLMPGPTDTAFFERAGMEDTKIGSGPKDDPDDVARDGFEALMAGRPHVVAGSLKNRAQAAVSTHLPDTISSKMQARMAKPGTAEDGKGTE